MNPRRSRALLVALLSTAAGLLTIVPAAHAAPEDPEFLITVDRVSPMTISTGDSLTVGGTVTNGGRDTWRDLQVYIAVPHSPFTERRQLTDALASGNAYTGERIVDLRYIANLGDLGFGESADFQLRVPWTALGFTGAQGVYPVGVQLLGTAPDGSRSGTAITRTETFVSRVDGRTPAPTTLIWPFLLPTTRNADNVYAKEKEFTRSLGPDGQLRHLLDAAEASQGNGISVLLDPALLDAAADLAEGRHSSPSGKEREDAREFLTDLRALANRGSTWIVGYGRPDEWALSGAARVAGNLRQSIDLATERSLDRHGIDGRRVVWLTAGGASETVIAESRGGEPVVMTAADLHGWTHSRGSVIRKTTTSGDVPVLALDDILSELGDDLTPIATRQAILAEAAFAALDRAARGDSADDAVVLIPSRWDPGTAPSILGTAFGAAFASPRTLDNLLATAPAPADAAVGPAIADALNRDVLDAAARLARQSAEIVELAGGEPSLAARLAQDVALLTGVRWRGGESTAKQIASARQQALTERLANLTIEGPPSFTLSGTKGRFPLTISNRTDFDATVGVRIDSSNPALTIDDVKPVKIAAGERETLTVTVDVGRQKSSSVTATLQSVGGQTFGEPARFNLRSSNVDSVVWFAMGAAGLLVALTIGRRLVRQRRTGSENAQANDE